MTGTRDPQRRPPAARHTPPRRRALAVLLVALLVALSGLSAAGVGNSAPAAAAASLATVDLSTLDPVVGRPGGDLSVAGTVHGGAERLRDVRVALRLSRTPVNSRAELAGVASGLTTGKDGDVVAEQPLGGLAVNGTADFRLVRPLDSLEALGDFGVYVVSVEVTARHRTGAGRVGILRTFLPWAPATQSYQPTGFAMLWPLAGVPARQANGRYQDDQLATEMAPSGRLGRLATAGGALSSALPLEWALDGDLLDSASDMAGGYRVVDQPASSTEPGAVLAQDWLTSVRAATTGRDVLPLPYADPDLPALRRHGLSRDVRAATSASAAVLSRVLGREQLPTDLSWPSGGVVDRGTLALLRRTGTEAVVLAGPVHPTRLELNYTATGRSSVTTRSGLLTSLVADTGLTALLADDDSPPLLAAQRFVAETAVITAELPSTGGSRVVLAAPPTRWDPPQSFLDRLVSGLSDADWLTGTSLAQMRAAAPGEVERRGVRYPRSARRAELSRANLASVRSQHERVELFGKAIDPDDPRRAAVLAGLEKSVLRLESSWWHGRGDARAIRVVRDASYVSDNLLGRIRVQPGSYTLGSKSGSLPLTISNGTNRAIVVRLRLEPQNRRLRLDAPDDPLSIGARRKLQVDVPATAVAAGAVIVDATLHTTDGSPLASAPVQLSIRVTEIGTVALIITVGAAGVLFLAAAVRLVRRARAARRTASPAREVP